MSNILTKTTELAMSVTLSYIKDGDTAVDATCGNGMDTIALAAAVGKNGTVYAFDIQEDALIRTEERLLSYGYTNTKLILKSFETMDQHIPENTADAVIFNLGYLPGGDHSITTKTETTMPGLDTALKVIRPGGIVTIVMYDGHEEGLREKKSIISWAETLDSGKYHVAYVSLINQKNHPPEIIWITKKR